MKHMIIWSYLNSSETNGIYLIIFEINLLSEPNGTQDATEQHFIAARHIDIMIG